MTGEISTLLDLHIDPRRTGGRHLFRLKGYDGATIVSEKLKDAFDAAKCTGFRYEHATSPHIAESRIRHAERLRRRGLSG